MNERLNLLPSPAFLELRPALETRLAQAGVGIRAEQFPELLDPLLRQVLQQGFDAATAHEGTVWLMDAGGKNLVAAYNTGPDANRFVGQFKQPLNAGLIGMVFATEQPFLENDVSKNARQSKQLDALLGVETYALLIVPFFFLKACRGVVSAVQLKKTGASADPCGFLPDHLHAIQRAVTLVSRLIEYRLLGAAVGWTSE